MPRIGPLARLYYFATSGLRGKQLEQRNALFGSVRFPSQFASMAHIVHMLPLRLNNV